VSDEVWEWLHVPRLSGVGGLAIIEVARDDEDVLRLKRRSSRAFSR
jgi:hypothetical protein